MTEHTPGPWRIPSPVSGFSAIYGPNGELVFGLAAGSGDERQDDATCEANAALITRAPDLLAEVTRLRAVNAGLVEALKIAEAQFGFYGLSHRAKGTPDADAKAETNEKLVETMSAALRAAEEASQ